MTFVSYAQNFEDVLLWRALGHLETGFYIDIGASHPDTDSVTRAFYDRGWHGISVEPTASAFLRLTAARPRDVNLQLAIGDAPGTAPFYVVEGADAGLSTFDGAAVSRYGTLGVASTQTTVAVDTLASICREHAPCDIHFLKIDVEGAERAVLEGADFARYRPWIVLVEATAPMSADEVHGNWDGILLDAGYRFVWFDGLNRFYVAREHDEELAPKFRTPPNVFDNFLRAADTDWTRRLQQAETRAATLLPRAIGAESRAAIAEDRAEAGYLRLAQATAAAARMQARAERAEPEADRLRQELDRVTRQQQASLHRAERAEQAHASAVTSLDTIRRSTSWRITGPLRRVLRLVKPGGTGASATLHDPSPAPPPPPAIAAPASPPAAAPVRPALRAVHQFHAGAAPGDAITNAMLLTRRLLRGLGYASHIFGEHRDPACHDEIHPMDSLPEHDRYALLLRHSLGYDELPRVLALPAPKVLIYHNITPPDLLEGAPVLQEYARMGRDQLAALRTAVRAALADSEYNALELRQAGFSPVASCPLLFDVDALRASAPAAQHGLVFTILFVGRLARSKGQLELVTAYARFRTQYKGDSRLILVGRNDADAYAIELSALIRRHELDTGAVEITGLVSDDELRRRYAEADLYVSLSQHEGFGVPLVEAMACGLPVLAFPSGAVPYTLGGAAKLLAETTPAVVAADMMALAEDPAARQAIAERQRRSLDRFRLERQIPVLLNALEAAGVAAPVDERSRQALAANMRFTIAGHVNGTYSLAEINRSLAFAIEAARPGAVRLLAVEGDVTTALDSVPAEQRDRVRALITRPAPTTGPEVVISQHYPVWVPAQPGDLPLALFFWEESVVPPGTVATLNAGFAGVLAPSAAVAKALIDSGVDVPVRVFGPAPVLDQFRRLRDERAARRRRDERAARRGAGPFTFLHVSSCFPRKGVDVLLAAYAAAFRRDDPVRLVIKGFPNLHNTVAEQVERLRADDPCAPAVELIDADLPEPDLLDLYRDADAMVLPSRGEGFNLPAAEAAAAGIPLIVTGHGGHMDFLADAPGDAVRLVAFRFAPAATHLSTPFSLWAEPDPADLAAAMQEAVHARSRIAPPIPSHAARSLGDPSRGNDVAGRLSAIAADLLLAPPRPEPSVAWITTWDVPCGVAGYSRHLIAAMPGEATILADRRTAASAPGAEGPRVIPAWIPNDRASLQGLADAIVHCDARTVVLQHQPGLLGWEHLAALLGLSALQGRVVCVVLHSTQHLHELTDEGRRSALRSLASASRVVVHTLLDLNRLAGMGLLHNVTLIPQGVPQTADAPAPPVRPLPRDGNVLIGSYGFFLPGKGIPQLLRALALLRQRYPLARLRLVNAEYPLRESADEIAACRAIVAASGLDGAVEFVTGFLSDARSTALLAECDLIVLPYQSSRESSSAALRGALTARVPIAVTPLPLFDEAEDAVVRLPGIAPTELAEGIAGLMSDPGRRRAAAEAAGTWRRDRGWPNIARRWNGMLRGLSASGVVLGPIVAGQERNDR